VKDIKFKYIISLIAFASLLFWRMATPVVHVHYSSKGTEPLKLIWNTQHSIHKERILPGQATFDTGQIFPNEEFFMMFNWWFDKGLQRCVDIQTKRGDVLNIYLNETGRIDTAKTGHEVIARLKPCAGDGDPFRP
jgi:hypothetical protein